MKEEKITTRSEDETIEFGREFAKNLKRGGMVALYGDLGSGKTEFIKGICDFYNVEEIVSSPTFTILNEYTGQINGEEISIYHIDLYRIKEQKELEEIGFNDFIHSDSGIKLVEWADKADGAIPDDGIRINIETNNEDENERIFKITYP